MIVPTLASYGQNKITLDTKNIPMDYSISDVNKTLSPSLWSGCCVYFDAKQVRSLTGRLHIQQEGKKVPLEYVEVSFQAGDKKVTFPTGKGGEFYVENALEDESLDKKEETTDKQNCRAIRQIIRAGGTTILPGTYKAVAEYAEGRCEFSLTFPETGEVITDLGDVECVALQNAIMPSTSPSTPNVIKENSSKTHKPPAFSGGRENRNTETQPKMLCKSDHKLLQCLYPDEN